MQAHRAFWTGRFDLGNLAQAVWSTAHGRPLEVTGLAGQQFSRLGAHFDPIVVALAPVWWVWPDAESLLVVQALAVATGAIPVFRIAERRLASPWAATGFALAYLLYPATQWLVLDDFHPVAFATPLLLWGFWFLEQDRVVAFAIVAGLACLTKEQVGLTVAAIAIWYGISTHRWRAAIPLAVAGATVSAIAIAVVVPHYAAGDGNPFGSRYASVGGSAGGILRNGVSDPGTLLAAATTARDGSYLTDLLLPLLGLPLLAPLALLTTLPELLLNLLSDTRTQTSVHFHYTAGAIPGLMVATIIGADRLWRLWQRSLAIVPRAIVVSGLAAGILLGPIPLWRHVPLGSDLGAGEHVVTTHARQAARAIALVPGSATVSATNTLGAHLSDRRRILSFPVISDATWIVVDTERPSYRDVAVAPVRFRQALARLRTDRRFVQVANRDGVLVFRRR